MWGNAPCFVGIFAHPLLSVRVQVYSEALYFADRDAMRMDRAQRFLKGPKYIRPNNGDNALPFHDELLMFS